MPDQFTFLRGKCKAATNAAAMSFGVLLLLPASLGLGNWGTNIIIQEAFGQFNLPASEEEEAEEVGGLVVEEEQEEVDGIPTTPPSTSPPEADRTVTIQDIPTYLLNDVNVDSVYGFIGTTLLPATEVGGNATLTVADDGSGYVATGRFRLFANGSNVERFVTELNVAAIDGSSFHNITIEDGTPDRYEVTAGGDGVTTATVSTASSSIVGHIYINSDPAPFIENVPMTLTARGQVLAIENIDIDETRKSDAGQRDILSIIDGETIYGTRPRR
jgi:hypothetical protein